MNKPMCTLLADDKCFCPLLVGYTALTQTVNDEGRKGMIVSSCPHHHQLCLRSPTIWPLAIYIIEIKHMLNSQFLER